MKERRDREFTEYAVGFREVRTRAVKIRRARRVRTVLVAGAAAAIVVPGAFAVTPLGDRASSAPATTPAKKPPAKKSEPVKVKLTGLQSGERPKLTWALGRDVHRPDGTVVEGVLSGDVDQFEPIGKGWMVKGKERPDGEGENWVVRYVGPDGAAGPSQTSTGINGLVSSPEGSVVAWLDGDGKVTAAQAPVTEFAELPAFTEAAKGVHSYSAVAVTSEDCDAQAAHGCGVIANFGHDNPDDDVAWVSSSDGSVEKLAPGATEVLDWTPQRYLARESGDAECTVLRDSKSHKVLSRTCDAYLADLSPDGKYAIGSDKDDASTTVIFDAKDVRPLVTMPNSGPEEVTWGAGGSGEIAWEDSSTLLTIATDDAGGQMALVRIGVDGSSEYAMEPTRMSEDLPIIAGTKG